MGQPAAAIEDYYAIGDLRTVALVSNRGSIDWLCLPYFDSPSIFGQILGAGAGCFTINMPDHKIAAEYVSDTAIVEFSLSHGDSEITVQDFMVPRPSSGVVRQQLVRQITNRGPATQVNFMFQPAPDYGRGLAVTLSDDHTLNVALEAGKLILHLPRGAEHTTGKSGTRLSIPLTAGQTKSIVLEFVPSKFKPTNRRTGLLTQTKHFWKTWVGKGTYFEPDKSRLIRSAITLKLMQFAPTGAIVAAPTTSLPEELGSVRNWDYRYVWIRDATFALYAFTVLGYKEESRRFFNFIQKITEDCSTHDFDVGLMYTIWGQPVAGETELSNLSGYRQSGPVRIGNGAAEQFQLDVYGVLLDSIYFARKQSIHARNRLNQATLVMNLVHKIEQLWQEPDSGIWEARVGPKQYTYSRVMAWVGVERAKQLCHELRLSEADSALCEKLETDIKDWVWDNCFNKSKTNFQQYPGSSTIDATNFLFILVKFLDKHDSQTRVIVDNTRSKLTEAEVFIKRYGPAKDGLPGTEGAFLLCSFWLVSALAILEDVDAATALFVQLGKHIRPHGLIPEEIDAGTKEYLGNYPQAFSHMGYIMSAHYIHKYAARMKR